METNHLHAVRHFCADGLIVVAPARRGFTASGTLQVGAALPVPPFASPSLPCGTPPVRRRAVCLLGFAPLLPLPALAPAPAFAWNKVRPTPLSGCWVL